MYGHTTGLRAHGLTVVIEYNSQIKKNLKLQACCAADTKY